MVSQNVSQTALDMVLLFIGLMIRFQQSDFTFTAICGGFGSARLRFEKLLSLRFHLLLIL